MEYILRSCTYEDIDFIFELKKLCMKWYIDKIYGWDDEIQRVKTSNELKRNADYMKIIRLDGKDIGVTTFEKGDDYRIGLTIIHPDYQNKGIASSIFTGFISSAKADGKRIIIKVFKENPAKRLYERLGFSVYDEDSTHYYMEINR